MIANGNGENAYQIIHHQDPKTPSRETVMQQAPQSPQVKEQTQNAMRLIVTVDGIHIQNRHACSLALARCLVQSIENLDETFLLSGQNKETHTRLWDDGWRKIRDEVPNPSWERLNCLILIIFYFLRSWVISKKCSFGQTSGFCLRIQRGIDKRTQFKKLGNGFFRAGQCESRAPLIKISLSFKGT